MTKYFKINDNGSFSRIEQLPTGQNIAYTMLSKEKSSTKNHFKIWSGFFIVQYKS